MNNEKEIEVFVSEKADVMKEVSDLLKAKGISIQEGCVLLGVISVVFGKLNGHSKQKTIDMISEIYDKFDAGFDIPKNMLN